MLIAYEEPGTETIRAPVLKVFDGDGFKTMLWNTQLKKACEVVVRLGFTDAPELEQPGGKESKAFLTSLIADRWVELVVLLKWTLGVLLTGTVASFAFLTLPMTNEQAQ